MSFLNSNIITIEFSDMGIKLRKEFNQKTITDELSNLFNGNKKAIGFEFENSLIEEYELRELLEKKIGISLGVFEYVSLSEYITYFCKFNFKEKAYQYVFVPDCVPLTLNTKGIKRYIVIEEISNT